MFYDGHKRMDARFLSLDYLESPINTTSACDAETVMFNRFHQQKSLHFHSSTSLEASKVFEFCSKFYFLGTNVLKFFSNMSLVPEVLRPSTYSIQKQVGKLLLAISCITSTNGGPDGLMCEEEMRWKIHEIIDLRLRDLNRPIEFTRGVHYVVNQELDFLNERSCCTIL